MRRTLTLLSLAVLLSPAAPGQDTTDGLDRFRLFNACRPMDLVIESLSDDADKIALSRESLQAAAESRLRAARLYTEDPKGSNFAYLYVNVNVFGPAFNIALEYKKLVSDEFGVAGLAPSWDSGSTGTHGKNAGYIVSSLSQHLDRFLAAYLRVNEEACGSPAGQP